jgi:hypothetical protein
VQTEQAPNETAVEVHSRELVETIATALTAYASRSQELDSSLLDRLYQQTPETLLRLDQIEERLRHLEEKRAQLIQLGILDPERAPHKGPPRIEESKRDVLTVYVQDTESKLAVLEDVSRRIQILTDAVNRRFPYKQMSVSRKDGLVFHSLVNGAVLPLGSLSSGEQHEIVLLYELLFKVPPGSLVLIDEREISLHLAWQSQFLDDLTQMVSLGSYDVLIATHAPAIINDRWDLTVELKGPELPKAAAE